MREASRRPSVPTSERGLSDGRLVPRGRHRFPRGLNWGDWVEHPSLSWGGKG